MTSSSIQIAEFSFLPPRIELSSSDSSTGSAPLCGAAANYTQLFLYRMGVGVG